MGNGRGFGLVDDVEGAKERYRHIKDRPRREANFITKAQLHEVSHEITQVLPWGWDPAIRHELLKEGIAEGLLPSEERIKAIREMSSREWAVHHYRQVPGLPQTCGRSTSKWNFRQMCLEIALEQQWPWCSLCFR